MSEDSAKDAKEALPQGPSPLEERVARVFTENGPLSRAVSGFRLREGQREFALAVARTIDRQGTLVAEAGTGTGKTFAYLTPALLAGLTCIISTAGKALQDQLFNKDLPALSKALHVPLEAAVLKGRSNYVCRFRLELARSEGMLPERDSYVKLRKIERFAAVSQTGDKAELPDVPENDPLWPMVTSSRENCLGRDRCPNFEDCFVRRARERALKAQVVVVNHHLYLSAMAIKKEIDTGIDALLPSAGITVIDEAHQLPDTASAFFGETLSTFDIAETARNIFAAGVSKCRDGAEWDPLYRKVDKACDELSLAAAGQLDENESRAVDEIADLTGIRDALKKLLERCDDLLKAAHENEGRDPNLDTHAAHFAEICDEIEAWLKTVSERTGGGEEKKAGGEPQKAAAADVRKPAEAAAGEAVPADPGAAPGEAQAPKAKDSERVLWMQRLHSGVRFNDTPLSFAKDFAQMRAAQGGAWVFTSATLSSGGDFRHFKAELGIGECEEHSWPSPFKFWEQGCFYLPEMPAPSNNTIEHTDRIIEKTWPIINAAGGRTFLLCTSLAAVDEAALRLRELLSANGDPYPLLVQGDLPKGALIDEFRHLGNAILVGSMSFWQGVDVRGEALSLVIIDKLPFAAPGDPVVKARSRAVADRGGKPFFELSLPEAVITLKQGAGRLIRSETDRGMLILCDERVITRRYGGIVLKSLPDFFRTRRESKALEFFLNPEQYFKGLYR